MLVHSLPRAKADLDVGAYDSVELPGRSDHHPVRLACVLKADPARVVLDVSHMEMGPISDSVAVFDGTVDELTITPFEGGSGVSQARIELNLATAAAIVPYEAARQVG